jgi:hypothetical protein
MPITTEQIVNQRELELRMRRRQQAQVLLQRDEEKRREESRRCIEKWINRGWL